MFCHGFENKNWIKHMKITECPKTNENGFKLSKNKTVYMHFCQKCKPHPERLLYLNNKPIQIVKEIKFLGIILDSISHLKYLKAKCLKALNSVRVAAPQ